MNMRQFRYILTLAHCRSFSKAAEELNISQPSLSQYVQKIEKELGVVLFDRSGSNVRVTDAGKIYIEIGRKILDLEHQMQMQFSDLRECHTGSIVVGISPHRSICLMPHVLAEFHQQYPGVNVVVDERVGSDLLEGAKHGDFDLCITTLPVDNKLFSYELIMREEIVLAVPAGSVLARLGQEGAVDMDGRAYPAIDPQLLDGAEFVMLSSNQLMQQHLEYLCEEYGISLIKTVECRSLEAQMAMVKAGLGAALMPTSMARFSKDEKVCYYSFRPELPFREIAVVFRKNQVLSRVVRKMIDILKELK